MGGTAAVQCGLWFSSGLHIKWKALHKHLCRVNAIQWVTRLFIGQCLFNCGRMSCRRLEQGFSDTKTKRVKYCFYGIANHWRKASEEWFINDILYISYLVFCLLCIFPSEMHLSCACDIKLPAGVLMHHNDLITLIRPKDIKVTRQFITSLRCSLLPTAELFL